jgi:hypothetical protein
MVAYVRGKQAYRIGLPFSACPYPANQIYKDGWEKGWNEAQRKDRRAMDKFSRELAAIKGERT